jgi:hypothetical protein
MHYVATARLIIARQFVRCYDSDGNVIVVHAHIITFIVIND